MKWLVALFLFVLLQILSFVGGTKYSQEKAREEYQKEIRILKSENRILKAKNSHHETFYKTYFGKN